MNISKEQQRQEAIGRLQILQSAGMSPSVMRDFKEGRVNYSEQMMILPNRHSGILYWIDEENFEPEIREFETAYNALAYHAILTYTSMGRMLSILYVDGSGDEEYEIDREDLADGYAFCYVKNLDYPMLSEFGSISLQASDGGLVRLG